MGDDRRRRPPRPRRTAPGALGAIIAVAGTAAVLASCASSTTSTTQIQIESPKASTGLLVDQPVEDGLSRIARALDGIDQPPVSASVLASARTRAGEADTERAESVLSRALSRSTLGTRGPTEGELAMPPESGRLIPMAQLSRFELSETMAALQLRYQTELGYQPADRQRTALMGMPPEGITHGPVLTRPGPDGSFYLLRLGSMRYASQLPQLWAQGVVVDAEGNPTPSPDLAILDNQIEQSMAQVQQMRQAMSNADLERQIVRLSYTNTAGAINALKGMGVNTVEKIEALPATVEFDKLPMVTQMPAPAAADMALLGDKKIARGQFGVSVATDATDLPNDVNAGPTSQLLVLYHPAHPEQLSLVRNALRDYIDTPARQIFVEGMVLEISEEGLEELGVEWEFKDGPVNLILGTLDPTAISETLDFSTLNSRDLPYDWGLKIQALVREGKAEVLSRPSVLTIDNRQATIRVGEDIPIATSQEGTINSNKIAFNFQYIPTGILLNIRPRMTESGDEVSMLVDTLVSAQVAGRDLEIRSADGDLLASAPTISTRRVQTYARIANKTPFIIGGLVSRDRTVTTQKVPFLGDLPLIGNAFKATRTSNLKREVIIVLTPYVLPEENRIITRALPKDDDLFDSTGNRLFRDSYRIRGDDVFDLRFLAENTRLKAYRELARAIMANNFRLAGEYPFSDFAGSNIPGEEMLVQRMIYEVIKRTKADERVNPERIIYFEEAQSQGYQVRFLGDVLARLGTGEGAASFFERNTGKALAITYTFDRDATDVEEMAGEPIPDIALIDCPDRPTWSRLLWELNQPDALGNERYTVLLQSESDVVRLQRAMMMKMVILLNADDEGLNLNSFRIGKILHVPALEEDKVSVLDAEVARYFFISELYYAALIERIEGTISALDERLRDPEIQLYLDGAMGLPDGP